MKAFILFAIVAISAVAQAKSESVYTSIDVDDCKVISAAWLEKEPEIDHYTGHCAGKDGYTVVISGGDERYDLSLIYQGAEVNLTNIDGFHDLAGLKVEWHSEISQGTKSPFHSLIYRMSESDDNGDATETLYVVRLKGAQSCVVGKVAQSANMNKKARAIADDLSLPCLGQ